MDIQWQDPPAIHHGNVGSGQITAFVMELKKHPGKWALYATRSANQGGTRERFKRAGAEVVSRKTDDGMTALYVRWPEEASNGHR